MKHIFESVIGVEFNDRGSISFVVGKCRAKDFKRCSK